MDLTHIMKHRREGELTLDEIGRGMHKSFRNAHSLIEDANLLLESRPGRALSLAVLSLEETAKVFLLANAAAKAANGPLRWREVERHLELRSHQAKQQVFAAYGRRVLARIYQAQGKELYKHELPGELTPLLDRLKQLGFYVDVADGRFVSPDEFGAENREWAEWLIGAVRERLDSIEHLHATEDSSVRVARRSVDLARILTSAKNESELREALKSFIGEAHGSGA